MMETGQRLYGNLRILHAERDAIIMTDFPNRPIAIVSPCDGFTWEDSDHFARMAINGENLIAENRKMRAMLKEIVEEHGRNGIYGINQGVIDRAALAMIPTEPGPAPKV